MSTSEGPLHWLYEPLGSAPTTVIHPVSTLPYDVCLRAAYHRLWPGDIPNVGEAPSTTPAGFLDEVESCKSHVWRYAYHPVRHEISYLGANVKESALRGSLRQVVGGAESPNQSSYKSSRLRFGDLSEKPPVLGVGDAVDFPITAVPLSASPNTKGTSGAPRRMLFPVESRELVGSLVSRDPELLRGHHANRRLSSETIEHLLDRAYRHASSLESRKKKGEKPNPLDAKRFDIRAAGWGLVDFVQSRYQRPQSVPHWSTSSQSCDADSSHHHVVERRWWDRRVYSWIGAHEAAAGGGGGAGVVGSVASSARRMWGLESGMGVHVGLAPESQDPTVLLDVAAADVADEEGPYFDDPTAASSALHHTKISQDPHPNDDSQRQQRQRSGILNRFCEKMFQAMITSPFDPKAYPVKLFGYVEPTTVGNGKCWFQQARFAIFRLNGDASALNPATLVKVVATTPRTMIARPSLFTPYELDAGSKTTLAPKLWHLQGSVFPAASRGAVRVSWFPAAKETPDTFATHEGPAHSRCEAAVGVRSGFDRTLQRALQRVLYGVGAAYGGPAANLGFYSFTCTTEANAVRALNGKHANKYTASPMQPTDNKRVRGEEFVRRRLTEKVSDPLGVFQDTEVALEWRRYSRPNWSFQAYARMVSRTPYSNTLRLLDDPENVSRTDDVDGISGRRDDGPSASLSGGLRVRYDATGPLFVSDPPRMLGSLFLNHAISVDKRMARVSKDEAQAVVCNIPSWTMASREVSLSVDPVQSRVFGRGVLQLPSVSIIPSFGSDGRNAWSAVRQALAFDLTLRGVGAFCHGGDKGAVYLSSRGDDHAHIRYLRGVEAPADTVRGLGVQSTPPGAATTPSRCYYTHNSSHSNWFVAGSAEIAKALPYFPSARMLLFWNAHVGPSPADVSNAHPSASSYPRRWKTVDTTTSQPPLIGLGGLSGAVHHLRSHIGIDIDATVGYAMHLRDGTQWGRFNDILPTRMECQWSWLSHAVAASGSKNEVGSERPVRGAISSTSSPSPYTLPPGFNFSRFVKCGIVWSSEQRPT